MSKKLKKKGVNQNVDKKDIEDLPKGIYGEPTAIMPTEEAEKHKIEDVDIDEIDIKEDDDSPFKELRNLIDDHKIKVKTVLSEKQVTNLQKLSLHTSLLKTAEETLPIKSPSYRKRRNNIERVRRLVDNYSNNFMILIINKDGLSRKQFIEALHKGSDKAEEQQMRKLNKVMDI